MNTINLKLDDSVSYMDAYRAALKAARESEGNVLLVAWYDRVRNVQGPTETCDGENWRCALEYAEHHDADLRVAINTDRYEFFFARATGVFTELNEEDLLEVHLGIAEDDFNNVQGG